jgi:enoyl-CoA hydratase/carnithine racemase
MTSLIRVEQQENVQTITLSRPEVRNALSSQLVEELRKSVDFLAIDKNIRAVIFTGDGDKAFSAGADLKERQGMSEQDTLAFVTKIQRLFQHIACLPMPTIAAINGDAFGGGLELALACDMRVMNKSALIGLTEVSLGIIPGAGGTQRLPRLIGLSAAMELIFSARRLSAQDAFQRGLVNSLADDARKEAMLLAGIIAHNAPLAIRAAKKAILCTQEKSLGDGLVEELASYHQILDSDDRKEGLRAFLNKQTPVFRGV